MPMRFELSGRALPPASLSELSEAERLVVALYRRWVLGLQGSPGTHWSLVWKELAHKLGPADGGAALSAFAALVCGLQRSARRTLYHHQPCCPCLCADELALVGLVSACQQGEWPSARALAMGLVQVEAVEDLLAAAARLAELMARRGQTLTRSPAALVPGDAAWSAPPSRARH
jgi:hypothetical protein